VGGKILGMCARRRIHKPFASHGIVQDLFGAGVSCLIVCGDSCGEGDVAGHLHIAKWV
jgi:hypothetical protein